MKLDIIGGNAEGNMKWIWRECFRWKYEIGYNWRLQAEI
jgi:hypothetical protein